jgi:hypothetical protein
MVKNLRYVKERMRTARKATKSIVPFDTVYHSILTRRFPSIAVPTLCHTPPRVIGRCQDARVFSRSASRNTRVWKRIGARQAMTVQCARTVLRTITAVVRRHTSVCQFYMTFNVTDIICKECTTTSLTFLVIMGVIGVISLGFFAKYAPYFKGLGTPRIMFGYFQVLCERDCYL